MSILLPQMSIHPPKRSSSGMLEAVSGAALSVIMPKEQWFTKASMLVMCIVAGAYLFEIVTLWWSFSIVVMYSGSQCYLLVKYPVVVPVLAQRLQMIPSTTRRGRAFGKILANHRVQLGRSTALRAPFAFPRRLFMRLLLTRACRTNQVRVASPSQSTRSKSCSAWENKSAYGQFGVAIANLTLF